MYCSGNHFETLHCNNGPCPGKFPQLHYLTKLKSPQDFIFLERGISLGSLANKILFSFLQLMVNGRVGTIFLVVFRADEVNETAHELAPTHPPREAEKIAQELASKRLIVTMHHVQASCLHVGLPNFS